MSYGFVRKGWLLAVLLFTFAQPAFAYIDPGTGSMLLQGLLAGVAGVVVVLKLYWYRLKKFFSPRSTNDLPSRELRQDPEASEDPKTKNQS